MGPREIFGVESINQLPSILQDLGSKSIFLVTGKDSFEKLDKKINIIKLLSDFSIAHFNDFKVNPRLEDIRKGIDALNRAGADAVVAIGGGSVIDVAKAISSLAHQVSDPSEFILGTKQLTPSNIPLISIPTTAGSGSEATHFAVVYIDGKKYSLAHKSILPHTSIIDPALTYDLPPNITAASGLDALSQAIESFWSVKSTNISKKYAKDAISLILPHLENAVCNPSPEDRWALSKGAHMAGKAINISFTTACHAISYSITTRFAVAHGFAVAITLPSMIKYNAGVHENDVQDKRGVKYVKSMMQELYTLLGSTSSDSASQKIIGLLKKIGAPTHLSDVGITTKTHFDNLLKQGYNPQRMQNNPRIIPQGSFLRLLRETA